MTSSLRVLFLASALGLPVAFRLGAQSAGIEFPAASPLSTVKQRVGLTDIEVVYSRPGVKGRSIFGELVPYGEVWRTGANGVTKVTFSTPVELNGYEIPAGTYGLFTIPGPTEWTVILNQGAGLTGGYQYDEKADRLRFKVTPVPQAEVRETFTIDINDIRDNTATLKLIWDRVAVPIRLKVDVAKKLLPQIEIAMAAAEGQRPYFQAAQFYYDQGLDLAKAGQWVEAAIAQQEAHYIVHLKAKILAKRGDKPGALAAATRSKDLAVAAKDTGYIKLNDDLIASLKQHP